MEDIILGFEEMGVTTHYSLELPSIGKASTEVGDFMGYSVLTYSMNKKSYKKLFIKRLIEIIGGFVRLILIGIITVFLTPAINSSRQDQSSSSRYEWGKWQEF